MPPFMESALLMSYSHFRPARESQVKQSQGEGDEKPGGVEAPSGKSALTVGACLRSRWDMANRV